VYVQEQGFVTSTAMLTEMLDKAAYYENLHAAKWLREQGAEWPTVLKGLAWKGQDKVLAWARSEGCTSPITGHDIN
jgi:hypothetical protein